MCFSSSLQQTSYQLHNQWIQLHWRFSIFEPTSETQQGIDLCFLHDTHSSNLWIYWMSDYLDALLVSQVTTRFRI